ncbi:hypothetical protein ACFQH6_10250 [Halobacteriaceae archaeon GCM10025711]
MTQGIATLPSRTYRRVDVATKLAGLVLVAFALEAGIASAAGVPLAIGGAALAVCTVFISEVHE